MALVITLILLAVTLVMAVAFLAIARRERNAVTTTTDTTVARLATDTALSAAQAQIAANILFSTNLGTYNYSLLVSTNYQNAVGYVPLSQSATNVNYGYRFGGGALNAADMIQNIANLYLLPRAPVFVYNRNTTSNDFRFYLDLNRNSRFETNGVVGEIDSTGTFTGNSLTNVGDPEWVGVLERPDQPHSPNNQFVARYAFCAQPIGNSLDLNYIHNQSLNTSLGVADGYFRNQGVGSWELNLAAFLADLNSNEWGQTIGAPGLFYQYNYPVTGFANAGYAFEDSRALLAWRYNNNYNSLASANQVFFNAPNIFPYDAIDAYGDGVLQTTLNTNADLFTPDNPALSWPGADNPNKFFSLPSDLFDPAKSSANFVNHLWNTGTSNSTYDRYTFYRLLDQLGTDSSADSGKLNLNYSNALVTYNGSGIVTGIELLPGAETNLVPWSATNFFHAAADRLLRTYTTNWFNADYRSFTNTFAVTAPFSITNIPVWVSNRFVYTPAVNRLLQLAANIYDATTNSPFPTVFRPVFRVVQNGSDRDIFISSYTQVTSVDPATINSPANSLYQPYSLPDDINLLPPAVYNINVYGVPWIIGAKKGLPGLNQFSMVNAGQFERLLEVERSSLAGPVVRTNQLCLISLTNNLGVSFWNSYSNDYVASGTLAVYVNNSVRMGLTNSDWTAPYLNTFATNFYYAFPGNRWPGSKWGVNDSGSPAANAFVTVNWNNVLVPVEAYDFSQKKFTSNVQTAWDPTLSPLPRLGLMVTNRLQAFILDGSHVIDYVQLRDPIDNGDLASALKDPNNGGPPTGGAPNYYLWLTDAYNGKWPSWGIIDQLTISTINVNPANGAGVWKNPPQTIPGLDPKLAARYFFAAAFTPSHTFNYNGKTYTNAQLVSQAPFTPVRTIFVPYLYQVNDPLVHYLASDLDAGKAGVWAGNNNAQANGIWHQDNGAVSTTYPTTPNAMNPGMVSGFSRYQPWGQSAPAAVNDSSHDFSNPYNLTYKDPLVAGPDLWDFPTNQYPTVGWLGRVHRGSPWQTVYLKSSDILNDAKTMPGSTNSVGPATWAQWTGDNALSYGQYYDAVNSAPALDRLLFDVFTTRFNDNSVRGALSVNQKNLAAWSAVFAGMVVPTNLNGGYTFIAPAGPAGLSDPALGALVTGINNTRATNANPDGVFGTFEHVGDVLKTAALTEQSPFLAGLAPNTQINDELYEWLPQQALGLLRGSTTPRYVVYCYGQTLRPAPNSLVTDSGPFFGLCTNYQITAESAARAVIRVENATTNAPRVIVESYNVLPPN